MTVPVEGQPARECADPKKPYGGALVRTPDTAPIHATSIRKRYDWPIPPGRKRSGRRSIRLNSPLSFLKEPRSALWRLPA